MAYCSALIAFLAYGGWTLWLNLHEGHYVAFYLVIVHGVYAALLTLSLHKLVVWGNRQARMVTQSPRLFTWLIATALSFTVPLLLQLWVSNSQPLATIAPGFLIGQGYIGWLVFTSSHVRTKTIKP
jgi:hypothetical protein